MTSKLSIDVRFQPAPFLGALEEVARQIPYATKLALDRTGYAVQDVLRADLPNRFTIRSQWISRGIQVNRASKSSLIMEVGSRDAFMERQAWGGVKTAEGGGLVAVPREIRATPTQKTTRSRWPGRLLQRRGHFVAPLPSGDIGLFRRTKSGLKLLYVLTEKVTIKPAWPFGDMAWETIKREWPHQQVKAMLDALKGRRRR